MTVLIKLCETIGFDYLIRLEPNLKTGTEPIEVSAIRVKRV